VPFPVKLLRQCRAKAAAAHHQNIQILFPPVLRPHDLKAQDKNQAQDANKNRLKASLKSTAKLKEYAPKQLRQTAPRPGLFQNNSIIITSLFRSVQHPRRFVFPQAGSAVALPEQLHFFPSYSKITA
jgi:hypothetical protein